MKDKEILEAIFILSLLHGRTDATRLKKEVGLSREEMRRRLRRLSDKGYIEVRGSRLFLNPKGRRTFKVVFIGGTFEVIHPGHIYTIRQAKKLGDVLVAVVARDATVRRRKGRDPIVSEEERRKVLSAIRHVDLAILGSESNIYDTLEKVRPDIVALGYDQYHREEEIALEARRREIRLSVVRLSSLNPTLKTSKILAQL
ncbi:MAG: FAD synthase [Thaumarchaeota archaeon]|nr:MAG: FAD synthase [Nitrososphaerota archaeon]